MTATTFVAHDPAPKHLGLTKTFKAASTIIRGQFVAYATTGLDLSVAPATTALANAVGVAGNGGDAGADIEVYMDGCIVTVQEDTVAGTLDAGHWVMIGAVAGTVAEFDPAIGGHAATLAAQSTAPVGKTLKDTVSGSGTDGAKVQIQILVLPMFTASG